MEWTTPVTTWNTKRRVLPVDLNRMEKNTKYLKTLPLENFSLQGSVGEDRHLADMTNLIFSSRYPLAQILKIIPSKSELYIQTVSKDFASGYLTLQLEGYIHTSSDSFQLIWYPCPEIGQGTYNDTTGTHSSYLGNVKWSSPVYGEAPVPFDTWHYSDKGHLLAENPTDAPILVVLRLVTRNLFVQEDSANRPTVKLNGEDKCYMHFHMAEMEATAVPPVYWV